MKKVGAALCLLAIIVASFAIILQAEDEKTEVQKEAMPAKEKMSATSMYMTPEHAKFTEMMPGVSQAVIWGDPTKGKYGCYTKMAPGFDAGWHTHTADSWIVVLKGAYMYKDEAGEKRVAAGEFMFIPGGHKHQSGGDPKEGALFYDEGAGAFDLVPVKQ